MTPSACVAFGAKVAECFGEDANVEAQYCACDLEFAPEACGAALEEYYGCFATQDCAAFDDETTCVTPALEMACG